MSLSTQYLTLAVGAALALTLLSCGVTEPTSNAYGVNFTTTYWMRKSLADTVVQVEASAFVNFDHSSAPPSAIVSLNGVSLPLTEASGNANPYLNIYKVSTENLQSSPARFDGAFQVFNYADASGRSPILDSLPSPRFDIDISSPTPADVISKSKGVTVRWKGAGADSVELSIATDAAKRYTVPDNGSFTFAPTDFNNLHTGVIQIQVRRKHEMSRTLADGRSYGIQLWASEEVFAMLGE